MWHSQAQTIIPADLLIMNDKMNTPTALSSENFHVSHILETQLSPN